MSALIALLISSAISMVEIEPSTRMSMVAGLILESELRNAELALRNDYILKVPQSDKDLIRDFASEYFTNCVMHQRYAVVGNELASIRQLIELSPSLVDPLTKLKVSSISKISQEQIEIINSNCVNSTSNAVEMIARIYGAESSITFLAKPFTLVGLIKIAQLPNSAQQINQLETRRDLFLKAYSSHKHKELVNHAYKMMIDNFELNKYTVYASVKYYLDNLKSEKIKLEKDSEKKEF